MSLINYDADLIIIGAGPSGIFTAYQANLLNPNLRILIIEKGNNIKKRNCPLSKYGNCMKCKPHCNITTGFSGAGAFSDAKLSLYDKNSNEVLIGGNLPKIIGTQKTKNLIDYCDDIYIKFGGDTNISGTENREEINKIKEKSKKYNISLIDIPVRHLGTEKSRELYTKIQDYLLSKKEIEIMFNTEMKDLIIKDDKIKGVITKCNKVLYGKKIVLAVGRNGSDHFFNLCNKYNIDKEVGIVDIGVRFEMKTEGDIEKINNLLYEGKFIGHVGPFYDKVRTFCQNPNGYVTEELYDNELALVNGHAYKEKKSSNTNFAILSSHKFNEPFKDPIAFGKGVASSLNLITNGEIMVQRFGDLINGKRTWKEQLLKNSVEPTLKSAIAGDLSLGIPYRPLTNIINFIIKMNNIIDGFSNPDNLLYAPEIKFYSNTLKVGYDFETNIKNLYAIGDGAGITRGLMMASCSGVHLANELYGKN